MGVSCFTTVATTTVGGGGAAVASWRRQPSSAGRRHPRNTAGIAAGCLNGGNDISTFDCSEQARRRGARPSRVATGDEATARGSRPRTLHHSGMTGCIRVELITQANLEDAGDDPCVPDLRDACVALA